MDPALPLRLLDRPPKTRDRPPRAAPACTWTGAGRERLLCAACGAAVSARAWALSVEGAHEHRFMNPHGYQFHIGCFRRAPGCALTGTQEAAYSWFTGRSWQIAVCGACRAHLGWAFLGEESTFYGLILDRLRPGEEPEA
ncbi:MAG: cereblon family protein [Pseudomonadota bacterium]